MKTFGQRLVECRKLKNLSQKDVASHLNTSYTTIGKYERNEMIPSIEVAKKLANKLDTTIAYLLSESTIEYDIFKDKKMLERFQNIMKLPEKEKEPLLKILDNLIKAAKINSIQ